MTILSHFFGTPHITSEQTKESLKWRWRGITKNQKTTGKCPISTKKKKTLPVFSKLGRAKALILVFIM